MTLLLHDGYCRIIEFNEQRSETDWTASSIIVLLQRTEHVATVKYCHVAHCSSRLPHRFACCLPTSLPAASSFIRQRHTD